MSSARESSGEGRLLHDERGSVILIALMIMLLITVLGFSSLNMTDTELNVSQNDRCYKQNVYRAEATAFEVGQLMESDSNSSDNLKPATTSYAWLHDKSSFDPVDDIWQFSGSVNARRSTVFSSDNLSGYTVTFTGIAKGASLDMSKETSLWDYSVYGRSEQCGGRADVVIGYRKRY